MREKDKKRTIETEMYDALMWVTGGKLMAEKAKEIAKNFAKDWDSTNEAMAHKGLNYWAREIVANLANSSCKKSYDDFFQEHLRENETTPEKEPAMSYLIVKRYSEVGCFAVKTESGKALAYLVAYLNIKTMDKGIQILTVSNPDMFGEYKPYHFLNSEKDFIAKVFELMGD